MTYLLIALIVSNLFWASALIVAIHLYREEAGDQMAVYAQANSLALLTVEKVAEAIATTALGDPKNTHGSIPPGYDATSLPEWDDTDPNDGLYPFRPQAKMVAEDDFAFLRPEDVPYA